MSPDDESIYAVFLLIALIHIALLLSRAAEFIQWPWIIILIPEILIGLAIVVLMVAGFYIVLRERRRRRKQDGK